ncbi:MAG: hypothetical protein GY696_27715 [Gammaproteobacteria bacterium]|nr:hypothetical protein [Gammaproteobacteria bacterium]
MLFIQTLRGSITLEMEELQSILETFLRQIAAHPRCFVLCLNTAFQLPVSYHTRSHILRLVAKRFDVLQALNDFSLLFLEPFCAVLNHRDCGSRNSFVTLKAILKWIVAFPEERMEHTDRLMDLVRFQDLSSQQRLDCILILNQCPGPIVSATLPRLKEADWHRTCMEAGGQAAEFSNLFEKWKEGAPLDGLRKKALEKEDDEREKYRENVKVQEFKKEPEKFLFDRDSQGRYVSQRAGHR